MGVIAKGADGPYRRMASTMFQMAYGRRVTSMDDPLVMDHDEVEECKYLILPLR